jgi:hypothetical protein
MRETERAQRATPQSLHADIVVDFIARDTEPIQVTIEGMMPAT